MQKITVNDVIDLIESNNNIINFGSSEDAVDDVWIAKAEIYLGFSFTNSYKWFLHNYAGGEIGGEEIYSIYGLDFEDVNGGDIVYQHIIDLKNNVMKKTQLVISETDLGDVYFFDYTKFKDDECPIYLKLPSGDVEFYAVDCYEFLYKRIKAHTQ